MPARRLTAAQAIEAGKTAHHARDFPSAYAHYAAALRQAPQNPVARYYFGRLAMDMGRTDQAMDILGPLIEEEPAQAQAWADLGECYRRQGAWAGAGQVLRRALAYPGQPIAWLSQLAKVQAAQGEAEESEALLREAAELEAKSPVDHYNRGLARLILGDPRGWRDYESREAAGMLWPLDQASRAPHWSGAAGPGAVALLQEQGFGDAMMAMRYVPPAAGRVQQLVVVTPPALVRLLQTQPWPANVRVVATETDDFEHHFRCWPLNLPGLFDRGLDPAFHQTPYLTAPPPPDWLPPRNGNPRIAIAWKGNPAQADDRTRSFPLSTLEPLMSGLRADWLECEWISVQVPTTEEEHGQLSAWGIFNAGARASDLADTAGVLSTCSMMVTADTGVAHLAGAMGLPVHVLKSPIPDWHYELDRADCRWYPSMRVHRARRANQWDDALRSVARALRESNAN